MSEETYIHIFKEDDGFYFWDETGAHSFSPFKDYETAEKEYLAYVEYLNHSEESK